MRAVPAVSDQNPYQTPEEDKPTTLGSSQDLLRGNLCRQRVAAQVIAVSLFVYAALRLDTARMVSDLQGIGSRRGQELTRQCQRATRRYGRLTVCIPWAVSFDTPYAPLCLPGRASILGSGVFRKKARSGFVYSANACSIVWPSSK